MRQVGQYRIEIVIDGATGGSPEPVSGSPRRVRR
jgi:hypothetical protein